MLNQSYRVNHSVSLLLRYAIFNLRSPEQLRDSLTSALRLGRHHEVSNIKTLDHGIFKLAGRHHGGEQHENFGRWNI